MAKKYTLFQNIDKAFSGDWGKQNQHINSYDMSNADGDIIYKTTDKADYETKKLELQQNSYLKDRWIKANVDLSVTAYAGLNNVKLMYRDADLMDSFPEIGAALDIVSEESCLNGDTKIQLLNGEVKTIEELYNGNYQSFEVYAVDSKGKCKPSQIEKVICNGEKRLYEIGLNDGTVIKCTNNHLWLVEENKWKRTDDLTLSDSFLSISVESNDNFVNKLKNKCKALLHKEEKQRHTIRYIKDTNEVSKVYDLVNSSCNHCFAVKCNDGHIISHNCITSDKGMVVNVYSKSDRIKSILEDLFVNRLNIQVTAPMVVRAMCKYGNQFMLLDIDNKLGVKGWKQLPVFNMERIENGLENPYSQVASTDNVDMSTKFVWQGGNNSQIPFRNWQIAHFRLLTNSLYLPYGMSYLNAARRHWRMLSLMEDMMLIYRLERSIERRVYKIYVGAIDDADVQAYVENIANNFKRTQIIDPMTGQIDLRKNILPVHKNTPIPLLDGRTITIENLAKEFNEGKENYVYSVQDNTHQIVAGKVVWCGKNYTADKLYRITLDDDTYFDLAAEHELIMRDGSKKRADEVEIGESVMPFYKQIDKKSKNLFDRYEKIYNPNSGKYEFTHRLVAKEIAKGDVNYNTVHHKDFNKYNNSPTNLVWMDYFEHHKMHGDLIKREWADPIKRKQRIKRLSESCKGRIVKDEIKEKISSTLKRKYSSGELDFIKEKNKERIIIFNKDEKTRKIRREKGIELGYIQAFSDYNNSSQHKLDDVKRSKAMKLKWETSNKCDIIKNMQIQFDDFIWNSILNFILKNKKVTRKNILEYINYNLIEHLIEINKNKRIKNNKFITRTTLQNRIKEKGFSTITEFITASLKNHKIKNIEIIDGDDVYCMTVTGLNGEDDRHNFAIRTINKDNSWCQNGCFVSNCVDQDLFIPVRDQNAPTPIDTLSAAQNLTAMDDIKFVQNKVCTALRIPKTFLNFEEAEGNGQNLALQDIRFTRTVNRIQQAFLMELTKVASIHLYLLGFTDDLTNFNLSMNNPSTQAEQLEIDNIQKKISAARDAISDPGNGIPIMSQTRALKEIMKWSEKEIKDNLEEIRLEKGIAAELEKTSQIIKRTGLFDNVDRMYGEPGAEYQGDVQQQGMPDGGGLGGGSLGGGPSDFGNGLDNIGEPTDNDMGDISGAEGTEPTADMNGGSDDTQQPMESKKFNKPLLNEAKKTVLDTKIKADDLFSKYLKRLDENNIKKKQETSIEKAEIYDKSLLINEEFNKMINGLEDKINGNNEKVE